MSDKILASRFHICHEVLNLSGPGRSANDNINDQMDHTTNGLATLVATKSARPNGFVMSD